MLTLHGPTTTIVTGTSIATPLLYNDAAAKPLAKRLLHNYAVQACHLCKRDSQSKPTPMLPLRDTQQGHSKRALCTHHATKRHTQCHTCCCHEQRVNLKKTCIARVKAPSRHCCALSFCGLEGGWASGRRRKDPDTTMECPTQVTASKNSGRKQPCMPRPTHARAVHQLTNLHRQVPSLPSQDPQVCRVWLASVGRCADLPASVVLMFIHKMAVSTTVRSSCIAHPPVPSRRPWSSVVTPHPPARPTSAA